MTIARIICILILAVAPSMLAKEQKFRFDRPDAQTADLMGEFNQWKGIPMTRQANGTWTVKVSISPGTYGYKFLVDGTECPFNFFPEVPAESLKYVTGWIFGVS